MEKRELRESSPSETPSDSDGPASPGGNALVPGRLVGVLDLLFDPDHSSAPGHEPGET